MTMNFLNYSPARYIRNKNNYYVAYSVTNPNTGKLTEKRVKLNHIKTASERNSFAKNLMKEINKKLSEGFNPFLKQVQKVNIYKISDVLTDFLRKKRRELEARTITKETYTDYFQQLNSFFSVLNLEFLHEITEKHINLYLDDLFINKGLTACTRNHYLQTLRTFFNYCVQRKLIDFNIALNIEKERESEKKRCAIPSEILIKIFDYLTAKNEDFYLLACWLLYACFIRPSEICKLKISNINFQNQTIFIPAEISKNKKAQSVTIPQNVADYILKLRLWEYPQNFYIIGKGLKPAEIKTTPQALRKIWAQIREKLGFSDKYQFYSLKDTGITKMINYLDIREVRDQARHSNISITDVYTDRAKNKGNENIKKLDFKL